MANSKHNTEPKAPETDAPFHLDAVDGISPLERAKLRVECVKAALVLRTVQKPVASTIAEAKEFEAYVIGPMDSPEPEGEKD